MNKRKSKKIGNIYGKFILIDTQRKNNDTVWIVKCLDCGTEQVKSRHSVEKKITECEKCGKPPKKRNSQGHFKERIYHIYTTMLQRTTNSKKDGFENYGGRGIVVCKEWQNDFMKFYDWSMANGYDEKKSIDRIDVNKNYCPENCRWVDTVMQANNRRSNKKYMINGETKTVAEWAKIYGVDRSLVYNRLRYKWDIVKALTEPVDCTKHTNAYKERQR